MLYSENLTNTDQLIKEKEFQELIYNTPQIQKAILKILNINNSCDFHREMEFINGITADFVIYDDAEKINAIIECKRADIGATEYVRGLGQLFQYEYFQEESIPPKKLRLADYDKSIKNNILLIPSFFIKNTALNIGHFKYPESARIFEIHMGNKNVREISKKELKILSTVESNKLVAISQYYMRDNRVFELYILLHVLVFLQHVQKTSSRMIIEKKSYLKFQLLIIEIGEMLLFHYLAWVLLFRIKNLMH